VLKVDNADLALRPGMTATADITVMEVEKAVLVPTTALRFAPPAPEKTKPSGGLVGSLLPRPPSGSTQQNHTAKGSQQVWVLKDGQPSPVPITTGATNGGMTEVLEGALQPGMEVLIDVITGAE
jgi:HlyD family secretion protein